MTFKNCEGKNICELFVFCEDAVTKRIGTDLLAFGCNSNGELGRNSTTNGTYPCSVSILSNWSTIEITKDGSAIATKTDGTLWAWGNNNHGQLGLGDSAKRSSPTQLSAENTIWSQISTYGTHVSAIKLDGSLWSWGEGSLGALGNSCAISHSSPVQTISAGSEWKHVSAGCNFTISIKSDGTLWGWGSNQFGSLGDGTSQNKSSPVQNISNSVDWKVSASGLRSSLGIKIDGTLWGWGDAKAIGVGNPSGLCLSSPVQTSAGGTNWKLVSTSGNHSAGIKLDGTLWTWGYNDVSQLGNGNTTDTFSPTQICASITTWRRVKTGYKSTAGIKSNGDACVWGSSPSLCVSEYVFGTASQLFVWGCGALACLAPGPSMEFPRKVFPSNYLNCDWIDVSTRCANAAVIKDNNKLYVAGCNSTGQLGLNDTVTRNCCFTNLPGDWCVIGVGCSSMLGIKTDGSLWSWGSSNTGQLGNNSTASISSPVQTVAAGTNWCKVEIGQLSHVAAIKTDGSLWNWGFGRCGALGNNSTINRSSPVQTVSGGTNWTCASTGRYATIALKSDGTMWSWGGATYGRTGSATNTSSPTQIFAGSCWIEVSLKVNTAAAVKSDNSLWLWGDGRFGALGNNQTVTTNTSPVQTVSGGNNWSKVFTGGLQVGAIKTDGTLWMWGINTAGGVNCSKFGPLSSPVQQTSGSTTWKCADVADTETTAGITIAVSETNNICLPIFQGSTCTNCFKEIKDISTNGFTTALLKYKED